MRYKVVTSKAARNQIRKSYNYYEDRQEDLGLRFYNDLKNAIAYLTYDPYLFPIKFYNWRELKLSIFPYLIIYEIVDDIVIVAAVFHTSQNPEKKPRK